MTINYGKVVQQVFLLGVLFVVILAPEPDAQVAAVGQVAQWGNPFEHVSDATSVSTDSLALHDVLGLVAKANPVLRAGQKRIPLV